MKKLSKIIKYNKGVISFLMMWSGLMLMLFGRGYMPIYIGLPLCLVLIFGGLIALDF